MKKLFGRNWETEVLEKVILVVNKNYLRLRKSIFICSHLFTLYNFPVYNRLNLLYREQLNKPSSSNISGFVDGLEVGYRIFQIFCWVVT